MIKGFRSKGQIIYLFIIGILVFLSYYKNLSGFFQQDEWLSFTFRFMLKDEGVINLLKEVFSPSVGHFQPFNTLAIQILFNLFELNYLPYAITSVALHIIGVFMVFFLAKTILNDSKFSYIVALFFGITAASFQATSWVLADTSVHLATIFSLLSILLMFKFVQKKGKLFFIGSLTSLLVALLFKEISIGLFLLLPMILVLFSSNGFKYHKKNILIILVVGLLYFLLRLGMLFIPQAYEHDALITESQPINYLAYNVFTFPFKGVSQTIVPSGVLVDFSYFLANFMPESLVGVKETPDYDSFVQKKILEVVSITLSLIIIALAIYLWRRERNSVWKKALIFSLLLIMINIPVFALSPERIGRVFIIDSRNLYFISFGAALLIVSLASNLVKHNFLKTILVVSPLLLANIFLLNNYLSEISHIGSLRRNILNKIQSEYPTLPSKVFFYTNSDSPFYGLPFSEKIMPFQSGFGQTLLIWYYQEQKFPDEFLKNKFLWAITDQGYQEDQDRGFGYFRSIDLLGEEIKKRNLDTQSIIAFKYNSKTNDITNISEEIKGRVQGYLADKAPISSPKLITTLNNQSDINLVFDGSRLTYWDSKLAYINSQFIEIDLGDVKNLTQIRIDSASNKDQEQVGYKVLLSTDKTNWVEILNEKSYPPNQLGYNDIYFPPQKARYIKIEQIGAHSFAPWVIYELILYEAIDS